MYCLVPSPSCCEATCITVGSTPQEHECGTIKLHHVTGSVPAGHGTSCLGCMRAHMRTLPIKTHRFLLTGCNRVTPESDILRDPATTDTHTPRQGPAALHNCQVYMPSPPLTGSSTATTKHGMHLRTDQTASVHTSSTHAATAVACRLPHTRKTTHAGQLPRCTPTRKTDPDKQRRRQQPGAANKHFGMRPCQCLHPPSAASHRPHLASTALMLTSHQQRRVTRHTHTLLLQPHAIQLSGRTQQQHAALHTAALHAAR